MIKVIIFDADGVLINSRFSKTLEKDYGIIQEKTSLFFTTEFQEAIIGKKDLKKILPEYLKEWGWKKSLEDFVQYWFTSEHKINEDIIKYIKNLKKKGIKCCLATNQEKHRAKYMLEKMGFSKIFDESFFSAHLGHKKPSLEYYSKVMENLKSFKKEEVLFWDDNLINIEAAKKFGINAEIYTSFNEFKNKMAEYFS